MYSCVCVNATRLAISPEYATKSAFHCLNTARPPLASLMYCRIHLPCALLSLMFSLAVLLVELNLRARFCGLSDSARGRSTRPPSVEVVVLWLFVSAATDGVLWLLASAATGEEVARSTLSAKSIRMSMHSVNFCLMSAGFLLRRARSVILLFFARSWAPLNALEYSSTRESRHFFIDFRSLIPRAISLSTTESARADSVVFHTRISCNTSRGTKVGAASVCSSFFFPAASRLLMAASCKEEDEEMEEDEGNEEDEEEDEEEDKEKEEDEDEDEDKDEEEDEEEEYEKDEDEDEDEDEKGEEDKDEK
jgi:hypothetical protein